MPSFLNIAWPFWIQFLTIGALPWTIVSLKSKSFMKNILKASCIRISGKRGYTNIPVPLLLCLPVGLIGTIMAFSMNTMQIATTVLSIINIVEFLLLVLFELLIFMLSGTH